MAPTITTAPADAADVDQLRHEIALLRTRVARLESQIGRQRPIPASGIDAAFLAQLAHTTKGCAFSVGELQAHAAIDHALADYVRGSNKQLGNRLRLLAGRRCGAFVLNRIGRDGGGTIWIVVYLGDQIHEPR